MKFNVKNLFMGVVLIIVLAVVFLRGDQLVELGETMKQGSPLPLVAAILTQLGKYFAQSFAYSRSFAAWVNAWSRNQRCRWSSVRFS